MPSIQYLDRMPEGWFMLDIMRAKRGPSWDWVALVIDIDPDELKHCRCEIAFLYVDPDDYRPGNRVAREAWVRIPGKHRNKDAAWDAFEDLSAARH